MLYVMLSVVFVKYDKLSCNFSLPFYQVIRMHGLSQSPIKYLTTEYLSQSSDL